MTTTTIQLATHNPPGQHTLPPGGIGGGPADPAAVEAMNRANGAGQAQGGGATGAGATDSPETGSGQPSTPSAVSEKVRNFYKQQDIADGGDGSRFTKENYYAGTDKGSKAGQGEALVDKHRAAGTRLLQNRVGGENAANDKVHGLWKDEGKAESATLEAMNVRNSDGSAESVRDAVTLRDAGYSDAQIKQLAESEDIAGIGDGIKSEIAQAAESMDTYAEDHKDAEIGTVTVKGEDGGLYEQVRVVNTDGDDASAERKVETLLMNHNAQAVSDGLTKEPSIISGLSSMSSRMNSSLIARMAERGQDDSGSNTTARDSGGKGVKMPLDQAHRAVPDGSENGTGASSGPAQANDKPVVASIGR